VPSLNLAGKNGFIQNRLVPKAHNYSYKLDYHKKRQASSLSLPPKNYNMNI
jgi:hypothetical protein